MKREKVHIPIIELKEGMISAEQIAYNNVVLVNDNMILTEIIIRKLKESYFQGKMLIYKEVEEDDIEDEAVLKSKEMLQKVEKNFKAFSYKMEGLLLGMNHRAKKDLEEVRNFAKKIQEELNSPNVIIKNIVLYGSGEDVIYRHSVNVAAISCLLGKWVGFNEKELNLLMYSAILHDFGKTRIDKTLLNKPSVLTNEEFKLMKGHPIMGYELIKEVPYINNSVSQGILMHHERLDGSGYPLGLKEDKIHPFAKIIAIADTFDAINSDRLYKKSKDPFGALETIQKESLGRLDYGYCKIFIEHVVNFYMGEKVVLNTEEVCKIISVDINNLSRPLLLSDEGFVDLRKEKDLFVKSLII